MKIKNKNIKNTKIVDDYKKGIVKSMFNINEEHVVVVKNLNDEVIDWEIRETIWITILDIEKNSKIYNYYKKALIKNNTKWK